MAITANATCNSILVDVGGTLSSTNFNLTSTTFATVNGTFTYTGTGSLTVGTIFTNAGSYTQGSGTLTVTGNFNNSGTFTSNTGTVLFNGVGQTLTAGGMTFYNLTIAVGAANTVTLGSNIAVSNNLLLTTGTLDVSASNYQITCASNSFFTNNSATTALNARAGTVIFGQNSTLNGTQVTNFYNLTISPGAGFGVTATATNENIGNNLVVTNGTLTTNNRTFTVTNNVINSGTITFVSGTLNVTDSLINNSGATINYNNGTLAVTGDIDNSGAITFIGAGTVTAANLFDLGAGGNITGLTSTFTLTGNATLTAGAAMSFTTGRLTAPGNFVNSGTYTTGSSANALKIGGSFVNTGTFTATALGTVTFNGTIAQNISGNAVTFYNLTINNTGASATTNIVDLAYASTTTLTVTNNLTIKRGYFKCRCVK